MTKKERKWGEPAPVNIPPEIIETAGGQILLAKALIRRGIDSPKKAKSFLDPHLAKLSNPFELPDMAKAVELVEAAIRSGQTIGIWGDFDVDGQTSTALLTSAIHSLGGRSIYHIPVRKNESHGVNLIALDQMIKKGSRLILTCDTGITAFDATTHAQELGIPFIITDHHSMPEILPAASAVINPGRLNQPFHPLAKLCGVGVAYQLAAALFQRFNLEEISTDLQDLVAIGTIADLASITGDNRTLTQLGLMAIRKTPRPFIQAMFELTETIIEQVNEEHISFTLAPRLNALGRLGDANPAVPFILSDNLDEARKFTLELEKINTQRRLLSDQVFHAARAQIDRDPSLLHDPVIFLGNPAWPAGVIGIVASRLVSIYQRPVFLYAQQPGHPARGSARSIEGVNITEALALHADLLDSFGGHPMAAGFSCAPENLPVLRGKLNYSIEKILVNQPPSRMLEIEGFVTLDQVNLELAESLEELAPFGPDNPAPVLVSRNIVIKSNVPIGKNKEHLQLLVEDSLGETHRVIWWQGAGNPLPDERVDLAFSVRLNNFRGDRSVQLEYVDCHEIIRESVIEIRKSKIKALDFRSDPQPRKILDRFIQETHGLVWAEGEYLSAEFCVNRNQLVPIPSLALWSIPPSLDILRTILEKTNPEKLAFLAAGIHNDQLETVLKSIGGMIRFALANEFGILNIDKMAARICQQSITVERGLEWWCAHGDISLQRIDPGIYHARHDSQADLKSLRLIERELVKLLAETSAFRTYYLRAPIEQLLE